MANEQINVPSLVLILVLSGLIIRYLFFSHPDAPGSAAAAAGGRQQGQGRLQRRGQAAGRAGDAAARAREVTVERIQQMFPQVDRRTVLWDLQRTGGNLAATTERILAGRLETPPATFQPPPPPQSPNQGSTSAGASAAVGSSNGGRAAAGSAAAERKPAQPDLITRYNLQDKVAASEDGAGAATPTVDGDRSGGGKAGGKAWSSSRDERQSLLQRRRDEMILAARRKMEAKLAAEKAAAKAGASAGEGAGGS